jgi:regulator of sirC expression with transglutaminase-like and TPR domain
MQIMLQYVFRELRFRGDSKDYHNPENASLDRVIDRRKGLPIMLSVVVMFLARRLNLPFYGVNMPIHFMLMYKTHNQEILIDPFDSGSIVTYNQCCYFLKKNGIEPRPEHLDKADEADILTRCIRNLMHSYAKSGNENRVAGLKKLLQLTELKG